jgi:hypothetical protein
MTQGRVFIRMKKERASQPKPTTRKHRTLNILGTSRKSTRYNEYAPPPPTNKVPHT